MNNFYTDPGFTMPPFMNENNKINVSSFVLQKKPGDGDDTYYVSSKDFPSYLGVFAIMDGHGGKNASVFVRDNLHKLTGQLYIYVIKNGTDSSNIEKNIQDIVVDFLRKLEHDFFTYLKSINSTRGGTTIAMVIVIGEYIFGFNLGDSTAIFYNNTTGEGIDMQKHHLKEGGPEYERLIADGVPLKSRPDISFEYEENIVRKSFNNRAYNKNGSSIAMSGSFGDMEYGFLAKIAHMYHIRCVKGHRYTIMLYSDGLGDIFGSDPATLVRILNELSSQNSSLSHAECLVIEARRCWTQTWNLELQGSNGISYQPQRVANTDDCSCIVIELKD